MVSSSRIAFLGCTVVALTVAGVAWLDTGTARQAAAVDLRFASRPSLVMSENAIERSPVDEAVRHNLTPPANALSVIRTADTRRAAMEAVAALADVPEQYAESALAAEALSHAEIAVREEAIHALGERGGTVALQTLQQALQDPSPRVWEAAVRALVELGGDEAVLVLSSALGAGDVSIRVNVVDALGEIGGPDARRYLEQMLGDENDVVREAAAEWVAEHARVRPGNQSRNGGS